MRKRFDQYAKEIKVPATIMLAGAIVLVGIYHSFALFNDGYQRRQRLIEISSVDQVPEAAEQIKGWLPLPIDASEASKHPEKREMFFGGLDENRVAFTIGRDIKLPGSASGPLNYSIYPHVEIDGLVHDKVTTKFSFKQISGR